MVKASSRKQNTKILDESPNTINHGPKICVRVILCISLVIFGGWLYNSFLQTRLKPTNISRDDIYSRTTSIFRDDTNSDVTRKICIPGKFGDLYSQLSLETWTPPEKDIRIPMYTTHNLNKVGSRKIHAAVIVQHGDLRNANDDFCAAVNSLLESGVSSEQMQSTLIIAPFFPIQNDICWDAITNIPRPITDGINCGYPVWSNEGWKDGHSSLAPGAGTPIFSYDVFNMLITHLGDNNHFPNLRNITVFGFSAGAETVLRFAALPNYTITNPTIKLRYLLFNPSTYLYLNNKRQLNFIENSAVPTYHLIHNNKWEVRLFTASFLTFLRIFSADYFSLLFTENSFTLLFYI